MDTDIKEFAEYAADLFAGLCLRIETGLRKVSDKIRLKPPSCMTSMASGSAVGQTGKPARLLQPACLPLDFLSMQIYNAVEKLDKTKGIKDMREAKTYDYHVALITVTETEEAGLRYMYNDWKPLFLEGDEQQYYETSFERDGKRLKVVTAKQNEMGMTAAGVLTMKMITVFRPRYVIMVGIAAGIAHNNAVEQIYGDIVVPNVVWDYSSGKFVSAEKSDVTFGDLGFIPRPRFIHTDETMLEAVKRAMKNSENEGHIHIGPMACGTTVVANHEVVEKQIHSQYGNTAALDMESYSVLYAIKAAPAPKPNGLIIKSVCDYANEEKSDQYQKFAAFTSAQFAKLLYEKFLL